MELKDYTIEELRAELKRRVELAKAQKAEEMKNAKRCRNCKHFQEVFYGEDYGIDSLYHAQRILEKTLGKVDGYQTDDGILEHKCAISAVKKLYEQKPAEWSEEDEKLLVLSLNNLTELKDRFGEEYGRTGDCIEWLKSLKERYTWKPSDEQMLALEAKITIPPQSPAMTSALIELYQQLKKLRED